MIKMSEFAERRKRLMQKVGPQGAVILHAASELIRNGDVHLPYRQNSDFYYLTGFSEPEAVVVLLPERAEGEYVLFNRVRNLDKEIWDGPRAGQEGACKDYLADQAFPIEELEEKLADLIAGRETIYYPMGSGFGLEKILHRTLNIMRSKIRSGVRTPHILMDVSTTLHEIRLFKSPSEIALIRKAVDITTQAHIRAMQKCKPGLNEYHLEAELMYEFGRHGARFSAYPSIVGSGKNTCVLHYVSNNKEIADGEMVLVDAGCEYQNYASDITRSFPANGKFTGEQRAIYEIVLAAQTAALKVTRPGEAYPAMQEAVVREITQGLMDLGILKGQLDELLEKQAYFPFYMHKSGHWMGLDVHDVGQYKLGDAWRKLEPGIVLTVEPGIYISDKIPGVPARWHNIGVRIEDDILITENGHDVLSKELPKTVVEIESLMA